MHRVVSPCTSTARYYYIVKFSIAGGVSGGVSGGYSQAWLRGEEPSAHVHEGVRLEDGTGWVGVGQTLAETWRQVCHWPRISLFLFWYVSSGGIIGILR